MDTDIYAAHQAFASSSHGILLEGRIRYAKFNLAGVSNEDWVELLGADVNNLTHMPLTYGLAKSFIRHTELSEDGPQLSTQDKTLLKMAALIHDQGEAIIGDIPYPDKTRLNEEVELTSFIEYQDDFSFGVTDTIKTVVIKARDEVVFNRSSFLGRMLDAIETVGYVRTALRASRNSQLPGLQRSLSWLTAEVLTNVSEKLTTYAAEYPAVEGFVESQTDEINEAFSVAARADFSVYGTNQSLEHARFITAQNTWDRWLKDARDSAA